MRIEKKFYSEEAALWQEAEDKVKEQEARRLEGQRVAADFNAGIEAQHIEEMVEAQQKAQFRVIDPDKMKRFNELTKIALKVAEAAPMDIVIDTDHFLGQIRMTADCFMILPSSPKGMQEAVGTLFKEAATVTVNQKEENLIEMYFTYTLCIDIAKKKS